MIESFSTLFQKHTDTHLKDGIVRGSGRLTQAMKFSVSPQR